VQENLVEDHNNLLGTSEGFCCCRGTVMKDFRYNAKNKLGADKKKKKKKAVKIRDRNYVHTVNTKDSSLSCVSFLFLSLSLMK
jgi:hypothetical protein